MNFAGRKRPIGAMNQFFKLASASFNKLICRRRGIIFGDCDGHCANLIQTLIRNTVPSTIFSSQCVDTIAKLAPLPNVRIRPKRLKQRFSSEWLFSQRPIHSLLPLKGQSRLHGDATTIVNVVGAYATSPCLVVAFSGKVAIAFKQNLTGGKRWRRSTRLPW